MTDTSERPIWREHLGLCATAAVFVLVGLRIFVVSGYDQSTALAIIHEGGVANVALASALASIPLLANMFVVIVSTQVAKNLAQGHTFRFGWNAAVLPLFLIMAASAPLYIVACGVIAVGVGYFLRLHRARRRAARSTEKEVIRIDWKIIAASVVLPQIMLVSGQSWLPPERIAVDGHAFTGFVVAEHGAELNILPKSNNTGLLRIESSLVTRQYCYYHVSLWSASVFDLGVKQGVPCPRELEAPKALLTAP